MDRFRIQRFVLIVVLYLAKHADNTTTTPGSSGMSDEVQSSSITLVNFTSESTSLFGISTSTPTIFVSITASNVNGSNTIETSTPELPFNTYSLSEISTISSIISVSPDRTNYSSFISSRFTVMTDNVLFTNSSSYTLDPLSSLTKSTTSNLTELQHNSTTMTTSASSPDLIATSSSLSDGGMTPLMSSYSDIYVSSLKDLSPGRVTLSTYDIISSFTNTHNSPVISTTRILEPSSSEKLAHSDKSVYSVFSTDILAPTSANGIGTTILSQGTTLRDTPVNTCVTSASDSMSSPLPPTPADLRFGDLQQQISELQGKNQTYVIVVIVLAIIIALLISLIGLYIFQRRRYYKMKHLRMRGIDDDLFNSNDKKKRRGHRPYFDPSNTDSTFGRSGRISTASFGIKTPDEEPMNLLQSFNKATIEQKQDTDADIEKEETKLKIEKVKDEEL